MRLAPSRSGGAKVACDLGSVDGVQAQGGLGITVVNWVAYGGQRDFGREWAATPAEQVVVAERNEGGSEYVPDQDGCTGSW